MYLHIWTVVFCSSVAFCMTPEWAELEEMDDIFLKLLMFLLFKQVFSHWDKWGLLWPPFPVSGVTGLWRTDRTSWYYRKQSQEYYFCICVISCRKKCAFVFPENDSKNCCHFKVIACCYLRFSCSIGDSWSHSKKLLSKFSGTLASDWHCWRWAASFLHGTNVAPGAAGDAVYIPCTKWSEPALMYFKSL